jgi:prepilin-type N-terminal cleavage/methylation domain-containing protein
VNANRRGFTLIELLIVIVIIGILAAIAIPKFANTKEQAFVANMKSDLRNLITAEEGYFYENGTYYGGAVPDVSGAFKSSSPVTLTLLNVTAAGWAAQAAHPNTSRTCVVYYGSGGPLAPAVADGQVACTP